MEITQWSAQLADDAPFERRCGSMVSTGTLGAIGTALLHVLVLQSALLGTHSVKLPPPKEQGPGATLVVSENDPAETLILIDLPAMSGVRPLIEDLASAGSTSKALSIKLMSPDALPHVDIPADPLDDTTSAAAAVESADLAGRVLLFGRYSGQIQARIERAWRRPRSPVSSRSERQHGVGIADDAFRCQVRIIQDNRGMVQEVQLLNCNGTVSWQQSLVAAILTASPLPAPPNPTVFTHSLTLTFEGESYAPGKSVDDYDVDRTALASVAGALR